MKIVCKICGKVQPKNNDKSNDNFDVFDLICVYCGCGCKISLGEKENGKPINKR